MWSHYTASSVPLTKAAVAVAPLLGTLAWDQGCYYNAQCPTMSGGDCNKCPTGCLATAMAMIMKYHAYPTHGYSSHSYAHTTANGYDNNFGTLTANFGAATYNWAAMPNSVNSTNSAVATLMYHCGVAVDMSYDVYGSGAYLSDGAYALNFYFTYSCSYSIKSMYTDTDWKSMLKNSLDSLRPVLYGGQDPTFGGHAFICDGYQGTNNDYFHFNFGWSGSSNGYEYVDAITPSGTPDNFSTNQEAIFNIHPEPATTPAAIFTANTTSVAPNGLVVLTNTSTNNPLNYTWTITPNTGLTFAGGTSLTSKNLMVRFANTGYYTVSLTAANSAGSDTETKTDYIHVWIDESGIQQTETLKNISIFPNPTDGLVTISTGQALSEAVSVTVYNIIGSEVSNAPYTTNVKDNSIVLDLSACQKGLYFIKVTTAKGSVTKKIELIK
jgi:PKD repeat protein